MLSGDLPTLPASLFISCCASSRPRFLPFSLSLSLTCILLNTQLALSRINQSCASSVKCNQWRHQRVLVLAAATGLACAPHEGPHAGPVLENAGAPLEPIVMEMSPWIVPMPPNRRPVRHPIPPVATAGPEVDEAVDRPDHHPDSPRTSKTMCRIKMALLATRKLNQTRSPSGFSASKRARLPTTRTAAFARFSTFLNASLLRSVPSHSAECVHP